ncbi:MAG: protein kinase [bacterium]|nr:protein kinase [bacterium]
MVNVLTEGLSLGGRFDLVRLVGRGAVGNVWLARDSHLENEETACKILNAEFAENRGAVADLKREVLLTRRLRHPGIVAVYSFWDMPEARFITMEYVDGCNLETVMAERATPFSLGEIVPWIDQLGDALEHAHRQGVLHRDVKPANILLGPDGRVHLADFGIARLARETRNRLSGQTTSGTLMYMSPEQLQGQVTDVRSDLYSLAATTYHLLAGRPPFYEGAVVTQVQLKTAPPIEGIPEDVNRVLLSALAKDPSRRPASCSVFCEELLYTAYRADPNARSQQQAQVTRNADPERETVRLPVFRPVPETKRLGVLLREAGSITETQLEEGLDLQKSSGLALGAALIALDYVDESDVVRALGNQLQIPAVALDDEPIGGELTAAFPRDMAERCLCVPLRRGAEGLVVATSEPLDLNAMTAVEEACQCPVELRVATESAIRRAIDRLYGLAS